MNRQTYNVKSAAFCSVDALPATDTTVYGTAMDIEALTPSGARTEPCELRLTLPELTDEQLNGATAIYGIESDNDPDFSAQSPI